MGFAAPLALLMGLLALPLIALYLLKPKRREVTIASTLLWERALKDAQAAAPWRKYRHNFLLLLQLLLLLSLTAALARPLIPSIKAFPGDVVVVLDTSQSMAATDVPPSRFAAARQRVKSLAAELSPGSSIAVVTSGPAPRVLAGPTTNVTSVIAAVDGLKNAYGQSSWRDAAVLASSVAGRMSNPTIAVITDGGGASAAPEAVPFPVRQEIIRGQGVNTAILSLSVREGRAGRQLWASLGNFNRARTARVTISVDGKLVDARSVELKENSISGLELNDVPPGRVIEAAVQGAGDSLPTDDKAWFVDARDRPTRVLLYGKESTFLDRALSLLEFVEVSRAPSGASAPPGYDVYVLNGKVPDPLPRGNLFVLSPPNSSLLPVAGTIEGVAVTYQNPDSSLLRFVDLSTVSIATGARIRLPAWLEVQARSGDVPLVASGENQGRRVVALAFGPEDSDLPLQVGFPLLVSNVMRYLSPFPAPSSQSAGPGTALRVPVSAGGRYVARGPDGSEMELAAENGSVLLTNTALPGIYEVRSASAGLVARLAVNAGSPSESDIRSNMGPRLIGQAPDQDAARAPGRVERWWPLLPLALAVALVEWWLYQRSTAARSSRRRSA